MGEPNQPVITVGENAPDPLDSAETAKHIDGGFFQRIAFDQAIHSQAATVAHGEVTSPIDDKTLQVRASDSSASAPLKRPRKPRAKKAVALAGTSSGASASPEASRGSKSDCSSETRTGGGRPKDDAQWNNHFEALKLYAAKAGNTNIPYRHEDKNLSQWVKNQRALFKNFKLDQSRIDKLNSISFTWSGRAPAKQKRMESRLRAPRGDIMARRQPATDASTETEGAPMVMNPGEESKATSTWLSDNVDYTVYDEAQSNLQMNTGGFVEEGEEEEAEEEEAQGNYDAEDDLDLNVFSASDNSSSPHVPIHGDTPSS